MKCAFLFGDLNILSSTDFSPQIAIVGAANAGKTTLVQTLTYDKKVGKTAPTIGFEMKKIHFKGINFLITDLGGQKPFVISFWDKILPKTDGIIFLIDAAAPNHFILAHDLFLYVLKKMNNVPMLVLANKQDLPDAASVKALEQIFNFEKARMRFGITALHIAPTSALLGDGVTEALDWLCKEIALNAGYSIPLIHDIFIYHRPTGRPLAIIRGRKLEEIMNESTSNPETNLNEEEEKLRDMNPTLIAAFYSALSSFSQELTKSAIQSLKLRNSDPTRADHLLFNYMDDESPVSCLIIATQGDNELLLELVATRLIDYIEENHSWMLNDEIHSSKQIVDLTVQCASLIKQLTRNSRHSLDKEGEDRSDLLWTKDLLVNSSSQPVKTKNEHPTRNPSTKKNEDFIPPSVSSTTVTKPEHHDNTNENNDLRPTEKAIITEKTHMNKDESKDFHQLSVQERILELEKRRKRRKKENNRR